MPEIVIPCPSCQTSLLVDEQNAGRDVLCPGCGVRLTLPRDLSGASPAVFAAARPQDVPGGASGPKRNHPLYRSGHLNPVIGDAEPPPASPDRHATALPDKRDITPEEEIKRLAALAAEPASYDLHNVDTRGRTAFPCPGCHRPVWIGKSDWGAVVTCEGCTREVISPNPALNEPARMLHDEPSQPRQKTVLPGRRQVENLPLGEQAAAGRPRRQGGQMPPARDPVPQPAPSVTDRARTPLGAIEPIPARGDVEMAAPVRQGTAPRPVAPVEPPKAEPPRQEAPAQRTVHRINPERQPNFTPKHDADLSPEVAGAWGGSAPLEHSAAFRRTLTLAVIILLIGGIVVTTYLVRSALQPSSAQTGEAKPNDSPVQSMEDARKVLTQFFSAQSPEEMVKLVRHPEATLPRMKTWYSGTVPILPFEFTQMWYEQDNYLDRGVNFIFTTVTHGGRNIDVALEMPKDGSTPKVDWEHFASWSPVPWSEFLKTTSERPSDFRVTVTPIDYYNAFFNDRQRYLAFRVADRDNFGFCYAYCEAGGALGKAVLKTIREARQNGRVGPPDPETGIAEGVARIILRLHFPPEGQKYNQALIDALVWNDWLEP